MSSSITWLDQQHPFSVRQSRSQINGVLKLLGGQPRNVLDLGCGAGRMLMPLAKYGHHVTGVDKDAEALMKCRATLQKSRTEANLHQHDFLDLHRISGTFDAILCLGNTLMTIADVEVATQFCSDMRARLKPRGMILIDDIPGTFVTELTSGRWQNGLSPKGDMQMVWDATDAVFTIRTGKRVKRRQWKLQKGDVRFRLWCDGSLALVASRAGLSAPVRHKSANLLVMTRATGAAGFTGKSPRRRIKGR